MRVASLLSFVGFLESAEIVEIRMGSGDWFKNIIGKKKGKDDKSKRQTGVPASETSNGSKSVVANGANGRDDGANALPGEDIAAIRIQKAYRAYRARKSLLRLKGIVRLNKLTKGESIKKQSAATLTHLHSWGRIQAQIKERRLSMVVEGRLKQKKQETQLKLEAKLHDLEVEWSDGFQALEEILTRIHHREEAAVKRERALAYAFTHQWRPNSNNQEVNASELSKANWGWSWKERWIAARPWEIRLPSKAVTPKSGKSNQTSKADKNTNPLTSNKSLPVKLKALNGKGPMKARRLSFPGTEATTGEEKPKGQNSTTGRRESMVP